MRTIAWSLAKLLTRQLRLLSSMQPSPMFREFDIRLQALVEKGSAQILSRPSVLTLDNRMAYINVSEKIQSLYQICEGLCEFG